MLVCRQMGEGPALVLVHGYLGGAAMWDDQFAAFSRHFRCIAPNLAGFGDSGHLKAPDSIEGHARLVLEALDDLGVKTFHLIGHSMGGMVVQQMAAMAPARIEKLILYGTGPVGLLPNRFEPIETSRQRLHAEGLEATAARIAATWFIKGEAAHGYATCRKEGAKASLQAALASLDAWQTWDGTAALATFPMPTLVIWGDGDRSYGWSQPEKLWQTIADCRLAVVPNCAHNVHMEKPEIFALIVMDFLTSSD
ncbi:alpha/beta hydrolase [Martelella alba]|uniref:Alpha/beta hydrolase n=1 Tax=Martelella alba TaxID=2590451 RepID=A0A506TZK4_9HYPH|nr:alpha/beta hydrolase [Martelella alba]TPW26736.1 alpha/beta hydrolase [Martelella alba]